jgi:hypothetical protein
MMSANAPSRRQKNPAPDGSFGLYFARVLLNEARRMRLNGHTTFAIWLQYRVMVNRCRLRSPLPIQGVLL